MGFGKIAKSINGLINRRFFGGVLSKVKEIKTAIESSEDEEYKQLRKWLNKRELGRKSGFRVREAGFFDEGSFGRED